MSEALANSLRLNLELCRRMLEGVPAAACHRQGPGVENHPAWIIGHLAHSMQAIGEELGLEAWLDPSWAVAFGTGSRPAAEAGIGLEELVAALETGVARVRARLESMTAADLAAPLPDQRYRATFPRIEDAAVHVLSAHFAFHLGQLSCWLRAQGGELPSEMDRR
ncbi:MAG: DinB family protein [Planctomycetes bacterium]|nr:DinB family protein [Planctomycetota bacterium]